MPKRNNKKQLGIYRQLLSKEDQQLVYLIKTVYASEKWKKKLHNIAVFMLINRKKERKQAFCNAVLKIKP